MGSDGESASETRPSAVLLARVAIVSLQTNSRKIRGRSAVNVVGRFASGAWQAAGAAGGSRNVHENGGH